MQTKWESLREGAANTVVAYMVSLGLNKYIFGYYDIDLPFWDSFIIVTIFSCVSIGRNYITRRVFNKLHHKEQQDAYSG